MLKSVGIEPKACDSIMDHMTADPGEDSQDAPVLGINQRDVAKFYLIAATAPCQRSYVYEESVENHFNGTGMAYSHCSGIYDGIYNRIRKYV